MVQKRTSVSQTTGATTDNDHEAEAGIDRDSGGDMDMDLDTGGDLREMEESLKKSMATAVSTSRLHSHSSPHGTLDHFHLSVGLTTCSCIFGSPSD